MKASKRKKLEAAGWKVGSAREFLELSDEEAAFVELCWWRYLREGVEGCKFLPMEATYLEPEIVTRKGNGR